MSNIALAQEVVVRLDGVGQMYQECQELRRRTTAIAIRMGQELNAILETVEHGLKSEVWDYLKQAFGAARSTLGEYQQLAKEVDANPELAKQVSNVCVTEALRIALGKGEVSEPSDEDCKGTERKAATKKTNAKEKLAFDPRHMPKFSEETPGGNFVLRISADALTNDDVLHNAVMALLEYPDVLRDVLRRGLKLVVEESVSNTEELAAKQEAQETQSVTCESAEEPKYELAVASTANKGVAETDTFAHLYDLDAQIRLVKDAVSAFEESGHESRPHTVLYGPPGCGKSEVLKSVRKLVGEENVLVLDAPNMTKAGVADLLFSSDAAIPPYILIEEIEKCPEEHLVWLLSALDGRAEIRKNSKRFSGVKECKSLCIATCNDINQLSKACRGALKSRFGMSIRFPRPSKATMQRIVEREVEKCGGRPEWVVPAVVQVMNVEQSTDPRRCINVCLAGRDRLLDGSYQADLRSVSFVA